MIAVEAKDSSSGLNSVKRILNDTAAKAKHFTNAAGKNIISVALLCGVFKVESFVHAEPSASPSSSKTSLGPAALLRYRMSGGLNLSDKKFATNQVDPVVSHFVWRSKICVRGDVAQPTQASRVAVYLCQKRVRCPQMASFPGCGLVQASA